MTKRDQELRQHIKKDLPNKEQEDGTIEQEARHEKATEFTGNPNPRGTPASPS
ncbi:MAG TPA: hypothetical protein H9906_05965 [Candidatus Paenalcaligenes intestinipullorum]|uniref:Uncharacterized protein n=1 Tax=Candidatus Paenalcaligenes intestinipullorum TaxID=2838718 RepID=A0A9D2RGR4_9BURK|nr:hypothetical protein [Candidatus Paenalcaligenes intestinipullorum]